MHPAASASKMVGKASPMKERSRGANSQRRTRHAGAATSDASAKAEARRGPKSSTTAGQSR